ncbi:MAG: ABC transporter permease [Fermentimonas sp.]|jgi:ABC-2 type transport system permease protein
MNSLGLVIQREYLTRVRKKSFLILTILMPFLIVLLSLVPLWLSTLNDGNTKDVVIIDKSGLYAPLFESTDQYKFEVLSSDENVEAAQSRIGDDLFAVLHITDDLNKRPNAVSLMSEKQASLDLQTMIQGVLNEKVTEQRLDALTESEGVNSEAIREVRNIVEESPGITIKTLRIKEGGNITESSTELSTVIGMVFTFLIYMFILMYGSMVMQGVMEEKKSRVVEVMVSSVKPVKLLIGKIVGIGLVGLTQLAVWVVLLFVLFSGASFYISSLEQAAEVSSSMSDVDIEGIMTAVSSVNWLEIGVYFILYFIGGYVLYASIFAMFASAVDSDEDTAQFMTPVTIIIVFAFLAGFYSVNNPDGPLAFWTSLIPFTSPIVMMVRVPFGVAFWEILLSLVLLYGTFILISIVAAKIYRVGILMYGKKPSIKEMMRWINYK